MHAEYYEINKVNLAKIVRAKNTDRRIIAVGTTSARVLETIFNKNSLRVMRYALRDLSGFTDIFIYPGYKFKAVDALVTNFHQPESTLLMLVSAFAGQVAKNKSAGLLKIKKTYREAIKKKYSFFSYGDAMMIK
jgi:S-adenosylmethionine:tRNA ribosyltransferase-isomerase